MRVLFVAMPWQSVEMPSLAIGILKSAVRNRRPDITVGGLYANIAWAEALWRSGIPVSTYERLATTVFQGLGEWLFAAALHGVPEWNVDAYGAASDGFAGYDRDMVLAIHRAAPEFVERLAEQIVGEGWNVVALTSTFMQNVPSLALAQALKRLQPEIVTVMGGSNLDGVQGTSVHRRFPCIDYVVRGEGEVALPALLDALDGGRPCDAIDGLCWRAADGTPQVNRDSAQVPINDVPQPDFDDYFATLEASVVGSVVRPSLVLEAARGCWWGEKHHCKFCGLNGSGMKFRSKRPERVWEELSALVRRHRVLDVAMVDNILDYRYFDTLLPHIVGSDWDLRIHYEIKANLSPAKMELLRRARITHIQPGIESLSSNVLRLMDKGVSGPQNVATLREAANEGLTVSWNYLYGFPGEAAADYEDVIRQLPALVHLQPPSGAQRIAVERFSPYFDDPALGFSEKRPAKFYAPIYGLEDEQLVDMVFFFDSHPAGISGDLERRLKDTIGSWKTLRTNSTLTMERTAAGITIADRRRGWPERDHTFTTASEIAAIELLLEPQSLASLGRALEARVPGRQTGWLPAFLERLLADGLVFEQAGKFVQLATRFDPSNIRLDTCLEQDAA